MGMAYSTILLIAVAIIVVSTLSFGTIAAARRAGFREGQSRTLGIRVAMGMIAWLAFTGLPADPLGMMVLRNLPHPLAMVRIARLGEGYNGAALSIHSKSRE